MLFESKTALKSFVDKHYSVKSKFESKASVYKKTLSIKQSIVLKFFNFDFSVSDFAFFEQY